jgi:hypothetical protein
LAAIFRLNGFESEACWQIRRSVMAMVYMARRQPFLSAFDGSCNYLKLLTI